MKEINKKEGKKGRNKLERRK